MSMINLRQRSRWKDAHGRYLSRALFVETNTTPDIQPLYTLGEDDIVDEDGKVVYPSAKRIYMECGDPTEYAQAQALCEGWTHWLHLRSTSELGKYFDRWNMELEVKLRSESIAMLRSSDKGADHKWLAERGWTDKKVGRPSKEEKKRKTESDAALEEELNRISDHRTVN